MPAAEIGEVAAIAGLRGDLAFRQHVEGMNHHPLRSQDLGRQHAPADHLLAEIPSGHAAFLHRAFGGEISVRLPELNADTVAQTAPGPDVLLPAVLRQGRSRKPFPAEAAEVGVQVAVPRSPGGGDGLLKRDPVRMAPVAAHNIGGSGQSHRSRLLLTLHARSRDAFHKVLLAGDEQDQDGHDGAGGGGHDQLVALQVVQHVPADGLGNGIQIRFDQENQR